MYFLKVDSHKFKDVLKIYKKPQKDIAEKIGITKGYVSEIVNKRRGISKLCAYAFCKAISPELEINDLFIENN